MADRKKSVLVAMSGGVDSSVASAVLARRGYDVIGATLRLWDRRDGEGGCGSVEPLEAARSSAERLGIPHVVIDARDRFETCVLRYAWDAYAGGRTPNPCVVCNEAVKFRLLEEKADEIGADRIASGHHARLRSGEAPDAPLLRRGKDRNKDQSYFLYRLSRARLERALMPVGDMTKEEVRALAGEIGLDCASRPESQDACFMAEGESFSETLRLRLGEPSRIRFATSTSFRERSHTRFSERVRAGCRSPTTAPRTRRKVRAVRGSGRVRSKASSSGVITHARFHCSRASSRSPSGRRLSSSPIKCRFRSSSRSDWRTRDW